MNNKNNTNRKTDARKDYEEHGLSIDELVMKYGYSKGTIKNYVSREKWQKNTIKDIKETAQKAKQHLSILFDMDTETLHDNLFKNGASNEIDEIQNLATIMLIVAKGGASTVKRTFVKQENGELKEKVREVSAIRPDVRAGQFFMELTEKLATMVDVGEFETDEELEERYKGYYEKKLKQQREEFTNRVIE